MDKFGIFNLLNSFADLCDKNKPEQISEEPKKTDAASPAESRASLPPLQSSMISTMRFHDEFVKRVTDKNKKKQ